MVLNSISEISQCRACTQHRWSHYTMITKKLQYSFCFELCCYRFANLTSFSHQGSWEGLVVKICFEFEQGCKYWELAQRPWSVNATNNLIQSFYSCFKISLETENSAQFQRCLNEIHWDILPIFRMRQIQFQHASLKWRIFGDKLFWTTNSIFSAKFWPKVQLLFKTSVLIFNQTSHKA